MSPVAGQVSHDGNFYWDGVRWRSTVSADGLWRWDGDKWVPAGPERGRPTAYPHPGQPAAAGAPAPPPATARATGSMPPRPAPDPWRASGYPSRAWPPPVPYRTAPAKSDRSWLALSLIPVGFTTWIMFLYLGIRGRRPRWIGWSAVYLSLLGVWLALVSIGGVLGSIGTVLMLAVWLGGIAHGLVIGSEADQRLAVFAHPALASAKARIGRRNYGRELVARDPTLAREAGVGRPDVLGAHHCDLIDVNHASERALVHLPGINEELAAKIVAHRNDNGTFSSVDDLALWLDLPPRTVDAIRDVAVFVPGP
jgi:DNA uptake protein ComE-like DNA-binding protein